MIKFGQIKEAIDQKPVISFDLYDTLIKRDCYRATEIFNFIERKIDKEFGIKSYFSSLRVQAEIIARKKSKVEEISLDDIYSEISVPVSARIKDQIKKLEQEYEYQCSQWNPFMKPVYDYCQSQGKKIFIVTDMYLPEILIKRILEKLGIQYEALFVSSTLKKMKRKGSLFREVLKITGIHPSNILHIGDSWQSDYYMARKLGIQAVHIPKNENLNLFINRKLHKKNIQYMNLCAFINNHAGTHCWNAVTTEKSLDFFSETGYEVLGPVLYGYVNWLQEKFKEDGIEKVFFLSRDGQLMQKAYQKLNHLIHNEYMYASRKALIIPSLWMTSSIQEIKEVISWGKHGTISNFLKKIGLVPDDFEQYYINAGFSLNKIYEYEKLWKDSIFLTIFEKYIKQAMITHSYKEYILLLRYLRQLDFSGKVAIVDIGWFGHMQGALEKIIKAAKVPAEIYGYYLGLRPESPMLDHIRAKGYLFDRNHNQRLSEEEEQFNAIVEMFFTANHGTTIGYKQMNNGLINPVLGTWEYRGKFKNEYEAVYSCQKGALTFMDDSLKEDTYINFDTDPIITFANWIQFCWYPQRRAADLFGNLHFLDDSFIPLACPQDIYSYIYRPKSFLSHFRNSWWRMGFMTRILGDTIPYANGYKKIKFLYSKFFHH